MTPEQKKDVINGLDAIGGKNVREAREDLVDVLRDLGITLTAEDRAAVIREYLAGGKAEAKPEETPPIAMPAVVGAEPDSFIPDCENFGYATNHDGRVINWLPGPGRQVGKQMRLIAEWSFNRKGGKRYFRVGYKLNRKFVPLYQLLLNRNKARRATQASIRLVSKAAGLGTLKNQPNS